MPLDEADSGLFKSWVIKKLEAISDADSEVLADYVLALVKTDDSEAVARTNCVENLKDFIGDSAGSFVDAVFLAIATQSYDPSRLPTKPTAPVYKTPRRSSYEPPSLPNESRKRSYHDWDAEQGQSGRLQASDDGDRPLKRARRGTRGSESRGGRPAQQLVHGGYGAPSLYGQQRLPIYFPPMPPPPQGLPPFDPNNPLAALMAMGQAMGFLPSAPGVDHSSVMSGHTGPSFRQRCRDYDQKGFCMRGASCPFEHDDNALVVPQLGDEYDPTNAAIFDTTPARDGYPNTSGNNSRGGERAPRRGRSATYRGGRHQRAGFSMTGMNHNRSITSIVVEQIPELYFNEQSVRDFFSEFGSIENITLQPYKRLTIVQYDSYDAAKAAYNSPKSVFDNRFVKVYWHNPDELPQPVNGHMKANPHEDVDMGEDDSGVDLEMIAAKQEEAQRKHDEMKSQREEAQRRRQELDQQLLAVDLECKKAAELLRKKTGEAASPAGDDEDEQTKVLKAKLAELQSEALSLGIDPDGDEPVPYAHPPPYRGRGGYRGRFAARGRGYYQSAYRGGYGGARATMSLDNRPKTVAITYLDGQYQEHEEALRQYLMFNGLESAILMKHPGGEDAALVAFEQRFEAENFMAAAVYGGPLAASDLPTLLGRAALAWYKGKEEARPADADDRVVSGNAVTEDAEAEVEELPAEYQQAAREDRDMDTYDE